jgi:hypothetical protein
MTKAKGAFIEALEKSADQLEAIVGNHEIPGPDDPEGMRRWMREAEDPNWNAKWKLVMIVEMIRSRAKALRRGEWKKGDWPPFRPEEAQQNIESLEQIREQASFDSQDAAFRASVMAAVNPIRDVVEKYGVNEGDAWRFKEEDCDPMPPWENPPPAGT